MSGAEEVGECGIRIAPVMTEDCGEGRVCPSSHAASYLGPLTQLISGSRRPTKSA